jgi:glycosyltransferase involved in cell wall biosynthesis
MKNQYDLVSVITANYNCAGFIGQTIESVIAQTYTNWEMLIIDDCSTDNGIEIVENYISRDTRIKLVKTECNSGSPIEPRNIGIQNATGRFIAFLDSDDLWLPDKLERQLPLFNNSSVVMVYSNYAKIIGEGKQKNRIIKAPKNLHYKQLLKSNYIGCLTAMYDVSKAGKVYFHLSFRHEDYVLWLTILRSGYIALNTNTLLALYRIRKNSITSKKLQVLKWQWVIYRDFLKLSVFHSIYYFCFYAINAFLKHIK